MNVNQMVDSVGSQLGDPEHDDWGVDEILLALNNAQNTLANVIHPGYLGGLQVEETNKTVTTGELSIASALENPLLRDREGIVSVKVTNGRYATEIRPDKLKVMENSLQAASVRRPYFSVFAGKIKMFPTTIAAVDVCYLRTPKPLLHLFTCAASGGGSSSAFVGDSGQNLSATDDEYNGTVIWSTQFGRYFIVTDYTGSTRTFTVTPTASGNFAASSFRFLTHGWDQLNLDYVTCELNAALHPVMTTLALSECWGMRKDGLDRKQSTYKTATDEIAALNAKYQDAKGIANKNRG